MHFVFLALTHYIDHYFLENADYTINIVQDTDSNHEL